MSWCPSSIDSPPLSACSPSVKASYKVCTRPPTRSRASSTTTSQPAARRSSAAVRPDRPAPMTATRRRAPWSGRAEVRARAAGAAASTAAPATAVSRPRRERHDSPSAAGPVTRDEFALKAGSPVRSGVLGAGCRLEPQSLDRLLTHLELLDLAGHGHWELVDEHDVARHLEMRQRLLAEGAQLVLVTRGAVLQTHPCAQPLAVLVVRHADDLDVGNRGVG